MSIPLYVVNAFSTAAFAGNPAAVCFVDDWPGGQAMQQIAAEMRLSETAFVRPDGRRMWIRWFTPVAEVDLCGHATLAAAHVLFQHRGFNEQSIAFHSPRSGALPVWRSPHGYTMDFPADDLTVRTPPGGLLEGLGCEVRDALRGREDWLVVLDDARTVQELRPNMDLLRRVDGRGVIVSAAGGRSAEGGPTDFVSRFFAPRLGVDEDPVTGSAHTSLTPYWAGKLGKAELLAQQVSARGGHVHCRLRGDRVEISGRAVSFLVGELGLG